MDATRPPTAKHEVTANERLKRRSTLWQANAIVIAVLAHAAVLAFWPTMSVGETSHETSDLHVVLPPDIDLPTPPEQIARPAEPVISSAPIDTRITIEDNVRFSDFPPERLTPPRAARPVDPGEYIQFSPRMVAPRVLNQPEVERALARNYPPLLRDAGIGGRVDVLLWLDENGTIARAEIEKSSGREALDHAALNVVNVMKLSPALNASRPTRVIVTIPIHFTVR